MQTGITGYIFFGPHQIELHREHLEEEYKTFSKALKENEEDEIHYNRFIELAEEFVERWNSNIGVLKTHIPGELDKRVVIFAAEYSSFHGVDEDAKAYHLACTLYTHDVDFYKLFHVNDEDQREWK